MPQNAHYIEVERIGEYVNRSSCARRFKLDLDGRRLAKELPFFTRLLSPIDPVLQASGSMNEARWERSIHEANYVNLLTKLHEVDDLPFNWERFVALITQASTGERLYAREVTVQGSIGEFDLRGRMDFILLLWDEGVPHLRIVECKASRKDKTYHRIQLAIYITLVRQLLSNMPLKICGHIMGPQDVDGVVARLTEEGRPEDMLSLEPLDLNVEIEDVRRLLAKNGHLANVCDTELEGLPFQLDGKCDSCVMNVHCLAESARTRRLELLGFNASMTRAIRDAGIRDLTELAALDPASEVAESIRRAPSFTERLEWVIERAKARLSTLPGKEGGFEVAPLRDSGLGNLPEHELEGKQLVRAYISVDYDYSENRVVALSAHVTNSNGKLETPWEDGRKVPELQERFPDGGRAEVRGRDVIMFRSTPWSGNYPQDNAAEEELISSFFKGLVQAMGEVGGEGSAFVHLYFWSQGDLTKLMEGCTRCSSGLLDALTHLLGCREPLEQLIYSTLQDEVAARYATGWTGNGLVVVSSLKWFGRRYHWTRSVDGSVVELDKVFRQGLFDFVENLPSDDAGKWTRSEGPEVRRDRYEVRCRFHDSLPIPYVHAVWGILPDPATADVGQRVREMLKNYHKAADPRLLTEYLRARVHALRWVEEAISPKNRSVRKVGLDLRNLGRFDLGVVSPTRAAVDLLRLDNHVARMDWLASMRLPPRERVMNGDMLPLHDAIVFKTSEANGDERAYLHGHIDLERYGEDLSSLKDRMDIAVDDMVRVAPYDGDITNVQAIEDYYSNGANGIVEELDFETGFVRVSLINKWGSRYVLPSNLPEDEGICVTLDHNPSEFVPDRVDGWLNRHDVHNADAWFDLSAPQVPKAIAPSANYLETWSKVLSSIERPGQRPDRSQMSAVLDGLGSTIQLMQGPPGTGKTVTAVLATLVRAHRKGAGGTTIVATNTHYAIDRFMEEMGVQLEAVQASLSKNGQRTMGLMIVHLRRNEVNPQMVQNVLGASQGKHLLIGGTIGDILKFAQYSEKAIRGKGGVSAFLVDELIIDEASMMSFPFMVALATLLRPDGRMLLAGDHRQLSPIYKHKWEEEDRPPVIKYHPHYSAYDAVAAITDSLSDPEGRVVRSALETTYRLPWEVREIISGVYEEDDITLIGAKPRTSRNVRPYPQMWSTIWQEGGVYLVVHDEQRSKYHNDLEAEIIGKVLSAGDLKDASVAVMTPHRAQRTLLKDKLARFSGKVDIIDTVEKLQGGERPTVLVSGTQSDPSSIANAADFILNLNRSNVIFSRSQERLVVVCSRSLLDSVPADTKQYQTARLWKTMRDFCSHELQSTNVDGHSVSLFVHEEEVVSGAVVDVSELGETTAAVPAFTATDEGGARTGTGEDTIRKGRGGDPRVIDKFVGHPPIGQIVVDGSNVAWQGLTKPSKEQLITCYRDLKERYGFDKVYILVGPGIRHKMGLEEYDEMVEWFEGESARIGMRILHEAPGGAYDDRFTISFAVHEDLLMLTNDKYRDSTEGNPDLEYETRTRSVRYLFMNGHLWIGQWPSYWSA